MARNFYISEEALAYMKRINKNSSTGKIDFNLHFWWLCAQIGLMTSDSRFEVSNGKDMVDHFKIGALGAHQNRIRGFFLMTHILSRDAGGMDRELIEGLMQEVFAEGSNSSLTEEGSEILDRYAASGFRRIRDDIGPQDELKNFVRRYHKLVETIAREDYSGTSGRL